MKKGILDIITEKLISRKLLTFATATGLLAFSDLDSETWGMIAIVYIGSQAAVDIVKTYRDSG
jgi:hypothetical protein